MCDLYEARIDVLIEEKEILQDKLDIALKALENYRNRNNWNKEGSRYGRYSKGWIEANVAIKKIKEIN